MKHQTAPSGELTMEEARDLLQGHNEWTHFTWQWGLCDFVSQINSENSSIQEHIGTHSLSLSLSLSVHYINTITGFQGTDITEAVGF